MGRLVLGVVVVSALALPSPAAATDFNVNAPLDSDSDGACDADCTIRDAVTTADGDDTILVPPGTHTISLGPAGDDLNASGDIDLGDADNPLTIRGTGADPSDVVIDATGLGDRVFDLSGFGEFVIANLTITGGSASDGGGIRNAGPELTLSRVVLDGNQAPSSGGAILNGTGATSGTRMTILDSVLSDNRTLGGQGGGAIFNQDDGRLAIVGSTLSGNRAEGLSGDGGAIRNEDQASLTVATSRLEQNRSFGDDFVDGGGAIFTQNSSTTTVTDSVIADNQSDNGGGGIYANNDTSLTVIDSLVTGNDAVGTITDRGGGGIFGGNDSVVTILRTTLSGNSATFGGGGVRRQNDGVLEIVNTTVSGNTTAAAGGGVHADSSSFGYTRIGNSTVAGNTAGTAAGGIFNSTASGLSEPLVLGGTIVAGNLAAGAPGNCAEDAGATPLVSRGFNLDSASTCGFTAAGDLQNADPQLGPLTDNGGPTPTRLPAPSSPVIDAGVANGLATDQRGDPRTVDQGTVANAPGSDATDIGAVELELQPAPPPPPVAGDTTPPDTQITKGPKNKTKKKAATFEFTSTEPGSTFQCKLDDGPFEPCTSPEEVKVKKGKHSFQVQATDAAGNTDPDAASDDWKVKKKKQQKES